MEKKQTWEERFDEAYGSNKEIIWNNEGMFRRENPQYSKLKDLFRAEIQKARDDGYKEGAVRQAEMDAEAIQKAKLEVLSDVEKLLRPEWHKTDDEFHTGYNQARANALSTLSSLKSKYTQS